MKKLLQNWIQPIAFLCYCMRRYLSLIQALHAVENVFMKVLSLTFCQIAFRKNKSTYYIICFSCIYVQAFQVIQKQPLFFMVFLWNMDSPLSAILNSYTQHALLQYVAGSIDGIDFFTIHSLCISWHNCIWIAGLVEHFQIEWRSNICSQCNLPPYSNLGPKYI